MRKVGVVTDPSWLEPFINPERNMRHEVHMRMCPNCGEAYETYRVEKYGPAQGMASCAPKHLCWKLLCDEMMEVRMAKLFGIPAHLIYGRPKTASEVRNENY